MALSVSRCSVLCPHPAESAYPWHQEGQRADRGGWQRGRPVVKSHVPCCPAVTLPHGARAVRLVWVPARGGEPGQFQCMEIFEPWTKEAEKADALQTLNAKVKGYLLSQMSVPTLSSHGSFLWSALLIPVSTTHPPQENVANIMKRYFQSFTELHYLLTKICWKS